MAALTAIDKDKLKELLLKCWMTHDGMWFYHSLQEHGIEKTNRINKAAIRSLAAIEIERIRKVLGPEKIETFQDIRALADNAFGVLTDSFMGFHYAFPAEDVLHWEMKRCFAYEGMKRLAVIDSYECGVIYRVACWFDRARIRYDLTPPTDRCILHLTGNCSGEFKFLR